MSVRFMSWNIQRFSEAKAERGNHDPTCSDPTRVASMAQVVQELNANLVVIEEVTRGTGEAAVELLSDSLADKDRAGRWDFRVSDRNVDTSSHQSAKADKYGVIYRSADLSLAQFELAPQSYQWADRRPLAFTDNTRLYIIWHEPWRDGAGPGPEGIDRLKSLANSLQTQHRKPVVIAGDFNTPTRTGGLMDRLSGFSPAVPGALTTEKMVGTFRDLISKHGGHVLGAQHTFDPLALANPYDNVYASSGVTMTSQQVFSIPWENFRRLRAAVPGYPGDDAVEALRLARMVSDHLPVAVEIGP